MNVRTRDGRDERAWHGRPWPVTPVTLLTSRDQPALQRFAGEWLSVVGLGDGPLKCPKTIERAAKKRRARLVRELDMVGGVFVVADESPTVYRDLADPSYADDFVRAALETNVESPESVTRLVSTFGWVSGRMNIGLWDVFVALNIKKYDPRPVVSRIRGGFRPTVRALRTFQKHVEWLERLQSERAKEAEWAKFSASLTPFLAHIRPSMRWDPNAGARPCWTVGDPMDVLWGTLWDWATRAGHLRRCSRCKILFPADDPRQEFCARKCANRASAAAWYEKKGRRQRRAARRGGLRGKGSTA
jgi:hypothetical protein